MQIKKELQKNKQVMQEAFRDCGDIIMREFRIRGGEGTLFLAYTDNIVNGDAIQNFIMTNVMARCEMQGTEGLLQSLMEEVIAIGELTKITTMEEVFDAVLLGDTVLLMDGDDFALQASTKHFPTRGVNQAETEVVVQGPKDAFKCGADEKANSGYTAEGEAEEGGQTEQNGCGTAVYGGFGAS